ncbi:MAG: DUF3800 domain-containing protein [Opitutaceae bacterium]|jgi:hypothetical protein|nr:DUF3800 domain-containing protein [Opitutaceae bacterium]
MDTWCFIDESWQEAENKHIGVLAAIVCSWNTHEALANEMYRVRHKYFGRKQAKDKTRELKGKDLLGKSSFSMAEKYSFSKNLSIAREILEFAIRKNIRITAGAIHSETKPALLSPKPKQLELPFREITNRLLDYLPPKSRALMVFDQRVQAQEGICIAMQNFLAGLPNDDMRIRPLPLIALSNICAGLQFADIIAHIVGRHCAGDERIKFYYNLVEKLQMGTKNIHNKHMRGLFALYQEQDGSYHFRKHTKKESGAPGRDARWSGQDSS